MNEELIKHVVMFLLLVILIVGTIDAIACPPSSTTKSYTPYLDGVAKEQRIEQRVKNRIKAKKDQR